MSMDGFGGVLHLELPQVKATGRKACGSSGSRFFIMSVLDGKESQERPGVPLSQKCWNQHILRDIGGQDH